MKNVNQLFSWMTEMLEGSEIDEPMTLTQVVTRFTLRDMMERGESEEEADQVQLMTLHASKGLEFPYVYLVGMEEGLLPHQSSIDEDNVDEERRLAYVGITRAQKELTFTLCKERRQYGELVRPEPSRFLLELPQDDLIWEQERKVITAEERMHKGRLTWRTFAPCWQKPKRKDNCRPGKAKPPPGNVQRITSLPAPSAHSSATGTPARSSLPQAGDDQSSFPAASATAFRHRPPD
jgi:ATP-dependent DNA helicase Rep